MPVTAVAAAVARAVAGAATAARTAAGAASAVRAASAGASATKGIGSLFSRLGSNIIGAQARLAYEHDRLLRNWGAAIIKHAEKFGVPKRFAREYVHRYMYPRLIGGPHGHRPHVMSQGSQFASGDDSVQLTLDFGNLAGIGDIDLSEGIGVMEHVQAQLAGAETSVQMTSELMDKTVSGQPGDAIEAGLESGEIEAAKSMQMAHIGFERPDMLTTAETALAYAKTTSKPVNIGLDVQPINVHYASASGWSEVPAIDVVSAGELAQDESFSPIYVSVSNVPNIGESKIRVMPPTATNTYTAVANAANTPQHIMFGPGRFEVT
jgi:hypothetical protein